MCHCNCGKWHHGCSWSLIAKVLLVVGGINWGLVGVGMFMSGDWNILHMILGPVPFLEAIVYILVGISALVKLFGCRCKKCMNGACYPDSAKEGSM